MVELSFAGARFHPLCFPLLKCWPCNLSQAKQDPYRQGSMQPMRPFLVIRVSYPLSETSWCHCRCIPGGCCDFGSQQTQKICMSLHTSFIWVKGIEYCKPDISSSFLESYILIKQPGPLGFKSCSPDRGLIALQGLIMSFTIWQNCTLIPEAQANSQTSHENVWATFLPVKFG